MSDRIESRIAIIEVGHNSSAASIWVKNIGTARVDDIEKVDIFFGPLGDFYRVNCGGQTTPYWEYSVEGGNAAWTQATTLHITVHPQAPLVTGVYVLKIVLPNGIADETTFGVD